MAFPDDPLDVEVGLFIDGAWVDAVTAGHGVRARDAISIATGRGDWSSVVDSSRAGWVLDNRDGRWSPDYSGGAYAGLLRRNIPARVGRSFGDPYLAHNGTSSADVASTPDVTGAGGGSPSTPVVVSVTPTTITSSATTHAYGLPTVAVGDRLLLSACFGHSSAAASTDLDDWTLVHSDTRHTFDAWRVYEVYVADAAMVTALSGTSVDFTTTNAVKSSCVVVRTSGARAGGEGTAWDAVAGTYSAVQQTTIDPPSLATTWGADANLGISLLAADKGASALDLTTQPSGWTAGGDTGGTADHGFITAAASLATSSGTIDPGVWTLSEAAWTAALTFAYRPIEDPSGDGVLDIAGDIDLRIEFQLDADPATLTTTGAGTRTRLAHKSAGSDGWEWEVYLSAVGQFVSNFSWRDSSGVSHNATSEAGGGAIPLTAKHDRIALRVTLDVNNGASGHTATWYTSDSISGTWVPVGLPAPVSGTTSIKTNDAPLRVGGNPGDGAHIPLPGRVHAFQLRDGIDGTVVANPDFTAQAVGATSFVDSAGRTWTIGAGGRISDMAWRFHGELASIPVRWNVDGSDVWAPVEATGLFRRLRQGNRRLESALRRAITRSATSLVQYWPMEETGDYLTRFGAAVGTAPLVVTNFSPDTAADTSFVGSDPLPRLDESQATAIVDNYTQTDAWQVRWLQVIPDTFTSTELTYFAVITNDLSWYVQYRDDAGGQLQVKAFRSAVQQYASGWASFDATGQAFRMSLSVVQNGSNVDIALEAQAQDDPSGGGFTDTSAVAGVAGKVTAINIGGGLDVGTWAFGHLTLQSARTPTTELAVELAAYDGETAGARIVRLCAEEGIASRIEGDPMLTEEMGPQRSGSLMALLEECAATDLGILYEPRTARAVGYRTRASMINQGTKIALDYSAGGVASPLKLDRDDQGFANDVTVRNWDGTTARALIDDGSALSVSEPPVGAGRYDAEFRVNAQVERLPELAAGRLALTAVDEPRVSSLRLALHHAALVADPALVGDILSSSLGDLVTVTDNLTVALGSASVSQLVQGTRETIGVFEHVIDCLTSPGSPWNAIPGAIVDLDAFGGAAQVLLTWTEPSNPGATITSYDVERSATSATAGFAALATISPAGTYTDTTAAVGVQYWYRVRATNSAGDAPWSNVVTATPTEATDPPEAIDDLTATAAGASVDLAWSAPASTETITSYDIQRSIIGATGPWTDVEIDLAPTTTYTDTTPGAGVENWYRVRATSSEGDGPWSNIDSATPTSTPATIAVEWTAETTITGSATSHTITLPSAGINAGQLILIWCSTQTSSDAGAPATPAGYSLRWSLGHASSFRPRVTCFYRIADGSEEDDVVTLDWGATSVITHAVAVGLSGVDTTTPFDVTQTGPTNGGSNPDPASITPVTDGAWVLAIVAGNRVGGTSTPTISTGYSTAFTQAPDERALVITYKELATAAADNPSAWTWTPIDNHTTVTDALRPAGGGAPAGTPAPTIPTFSSDVTITAGQNVKSIIEAQPAGTHFTLAAGTHTNCENVKLKTDQHVRLATGCILEGASKGYCFRPLDQSVTGVAIGGDPAGARPIIRNYGLGTSRQQYGAIMGKTDDPLDLYPSEGDFLYADVDDWFIYHLDLDRNSSNGITLGSNWTIYDVEAHGHTVTGIGGDRIVGGLAHSSLLYYNALNPASGVGSNGANMKVTWVNADAGRTANTPIDRTKAPFVVSHCTFEAFDRDGAAGRTRRGLWFDLDCQDCLVEYSTFDDHEFAGIDAEGCNDVEGAHCVIRGTPGYGAALGQNFVDGAICVGESTNCYFHHFTLISCGRAIINRMSNRSSDWYNSNDGSFVNYAWAAGPRYWILATGRGVTPSASAQSNMWTGGNRYEDMILIDCDRVMINEGTDDGGMDCSGATPNDLVFAGNDYSGSPSIQFFNKSNTALNLAQWQALGYDT
jgi:hypothetical protein